MAFQPKRYIIVGNGIAGTTAAETLRQNDPNCVITLITNEPYPLYNRVALPRYVRGVVDRQKVYLRDIASHKQKMIDLLVSTSVASVNWQEKTVLTERGKEFPYDKLLIATGGRPNKLQVPGSEVGGIFNFQYMDDANGILECLATAKSAVITGGSYVAYDLTESLAARKLQTTWLIRGPRFLRRLLEEEGGKLVDRLARSQGIQVLYGEEIQRVASKNGQVNKVITNTGKEIETDIVGCGLGLTMNMELLKDTPVKTGAGIITDQHLQTDVPDIYAAGDVAEFYNVLVERHTRMGTWPNSLGHGRVAAANMMGGQEVYADVPSYSSTLFGTSIVVMGLTLEMEPKLESVMRWDGEGNDYRRLFFDGNRLVGAVIIGRPTGRKKLEELIRSRVEITDSKEALLGPE